MLDLSDRRPRTPSSLIEGHGSMAKGHARQCYPCRFSMTCSECRELLALIFENKRDHQSNMVFRDLAILDHDFLVLHPGALDVLQGLVRACDADSNGILKTLR